MKNIKNEKICAICYRQIAPSENVAHRVNQIVRNWRCVPYTGKSEYG